MTGQGGGGALACPVCGGMELSGCLDFDRLPVFCNVLHDTPQQARAAECGRMELVACRRCGHLFNAAFDPAKTEYSPRYENSLHFSTTFHSYAEGLARELVERYGVVGKTVVELACGKGDFLRLLCEAGGNRGLGFDPSYEGEVEHPDFEVVRDYFDPLRLESDAALVCCRHALEHIDRPVEFLSGLRQGLGEETLLYFEVPNGDHMVKHAGIWDLIYEHCGYFTRVSLQRAFTASGFSVLKTDTAFGGQFLQLHALAGGTPARPEPGEGTQTEGFAPAVERKLALWRERLERLREAGTPVALWGAGSKGVTFLNALPTREVIGCAVDQNPRKWGRFVPGTGHPVQGPEFLRTYRPGAIIVMNPIYAGEIARQVDALGVSCQLLVEHSPDG